MRCGCSRCENGEEGMEGMPAVDHPSISDSTGNGNILARDQDGGALETYSTWVWEG